VAGQLIHASVAFKDNSYMPRASFSEAFSDHESPWDSLVGQGKVDDIGWAQSWQTRLEMDLFDPSLAGDIGRKFVDAIGEHRWPLLKRIPFLALSGEIVQTHCDKEANILKDTAVSSLVDTGVVSKLLLILEEPDVDGALQATSSTCLYLITKSAPTIQDELVAKIPVISALLTASKAKQQLEHLTLLATLHARITSDIWLNIPRVLLDIVSTIGIEENDLRRAAACLASFSRAGENILRGLFLNLH
jgi:hypothetical protein